MTLGKRYRVLFALLMVAVLLMPVTVFAGDPPPMPPVKAITPPRLSPPPIPHSMVLNPNNIYNYLVSNLPAPAAEADAADGSANQQSPGRYVKQVRTSVSNGLTLYPTPMVCNNFNKGGDWASNVNQAPRVDIWTDWFAGWGPFAVDDGYYQAKNTVFSLERSVGPGVNYGKDNHAAKIGSYQPYAGGFGSPMISVPKGAKVTVTVKYLIGDHNDKGLDVDWASMGIKRDAEGPWAKYVNGYVRGQWAELSNEVYAGDSGKIMILLQGQSPAAVNSNIYFDDVTIHVYDHNKGQGYYVESCMYE
ncbi:MAG: hypothetical protein HC802_19205 [Caldilineaceae bacterium]|nr:hypothetical protein [Caldilineaceae bacterium]